MKIYMIIYGITLLFIIEGALSTLLKQSKTRRKQFSLAESFLFWLGILYLPILIYGIYGIAR